MTSRFLKFCLILILIISTVLTGRPGLALADLNNGLVISDHNFKNYSTMSVADINNFLANRGSWLANYVIPQYVPVTYPLASGGLGTVNVLQVNDAVSPNVNLYGKTVAQLIYDETQEHQVNPYVILATLQKESSAITRPSPSSSTTETWPMFYMYDETMAGCLNNGTGCNDSLYRTTAINYGGVGQQIAYATAWFGKKYTDYSTTGRWTGSSFEQYTDPIPIDDNTIVCQSIGTRILYLYTPHVQTSFYNLYTVFFGDPTVQNSVPAITNDTVNTSIITRDDAYALSGSKKTDVTAYYGTTVVGAKAASSWVYSFPSPVGSSTYIVEYKDDNGDVVTNKSITFTHYRVGDANGDNSIDISDLSILGDNWGQNITPASGADFNSDGIVNIADLSILGDNWGK